MASDQKIHLPSVGVNFALAFCYMRMKGKKYAPAVGGLLLSAIVQGCRPAVPIKKRDFSNDIKVLQSFLLIGLGYTFVSTSLKTKLVYTILFGAFQTCVKDYFIQRQKIRRNP
ncbi:MAG: hypothetical protein KDK64_05785 [Chlamydiia bacterium]|nr:hypothetical protein [Chlamydiia bacterium]